MFGILTEDIELIQVLQHNCLTVSEAWELRKLGQLPKPINAAWDKWKASFNGKDNK